MNWLNSVKRRLGVRTPSAPIVRPRLALESLEAREVPAVALTWSGLGGGDLWSNPGNWDMGVAPASGDTVSFPAGEFSIQDIAGLSVDRVTLTGGNTILLQQQLTLNGTGASDQFEASGATNAIIGVGGLNLAGFAVEADVVDGSTLVFTTDLTGPAGFRLRGGGTLQLDKNASYDGPTFVRDGVLALSSSVANSGLPNTTLFIGDGVDGALTAEVRLLDNHQIPNTAQINISADGFLNLFGNNETVGNINMSGNVGTGGGDLLLNGNVTVNENGSFFAGVAGGTLSLAAGEHTFNVADGKTLTLFTKIEGSGSLIKDGAGWLIIDTSTGVLNNTYTGVTRVKNGGLILNHDGNNTAISNTLVIGDNVGGDKSAFVRLMQDTVLPDAIQITVWSDGLLDLNGKTDGIGSLSMFGGADVTTGAGTLVLGGNVGVVAFGVGPATIAGNLALGSATRTFTVSDNPGGTDLVIDGVISGGAAIGLIKDGTGTMEIKGAGGATPNTYGGVTQVKNGVLALNDNGVNGAIVGNIVIGDGVGAAASAVLRLLQEGEITDTKTVTILGDGRFDLNGFFEDIGNLVMGDASGGGRVTGPGTLKVNGSVTTQAAPSSSTISGFLDLAAGSHTFTVADGAAVMDLVIDAQVSGLTGGVIKQGPGAMALNGANVYGGPTAVNAGTLFVNGTQPFSTFTLNGGVLAGTGSVGPVIGAGGTVAPGINSPGTLGTKNLALGTATYAAELNGVAANQFDQLKVVGTVNLTGSKLAATLGFASSVGMSFRIIDNDGGDAVAGMFNGLNEGATFPLGGRTFRITYQGGDGNDVVLTDVAPAGGGGGGGGGGSISPQPYAVGTDVGGGPVAIVYNPDGSPKSTTEVFETGFAGGVRTATGDVNGDGVADLIAGSGPGRVAEVRILDGVTGQLIRSVQPFGDFTGGVFVAAGDFNNDGLTDVVITPDLSGGPRVTVVSGSDGAVLANFFGIDDEAFRGGARAAAGDVNGDGKDDLVISAGFGGGPRIAVFDGTTLGGTPTRLVSDFFAFEQTLRNGAYVAAGDLNGDGKADLIFGGGPGGGPRVLALDAAKVAQGDMAGAQLANFFAGNPDNRGGVRVVAKNLDGDVKADLVVGDGEKAGSHVTSYLGATIATQGTPPAEDSFDAFPGFTGGVFVG